jgi:hypothetical protein
MALKPKFSLGDVLIQELMPMDSPNPEIFTESFLLAFIILVGMSSHVIPVNISVLTILS